MRVGIIRDWDAQNGITEKEYADFAIEDLAIIEFVQKER